MIGIQTFCVQTDVGIYYWFDKNKMFNVINEVGPYENHPTNDLMTQKISTRVRISIIIVN